jgi:hypothetical protein
MIDDVPDAEPDDPVDDYEDYYDQLASMLATAASGLRQASTIVGDAADDAETVREADELILDRLDEQLSDAERAALDAMGFGKPPSRGDE